MLASIVFHSIGIGDAPFNIGKNGIDTFELKVQTKSIKFFNRQDIDQISATDTPAMINFTDAKETRRL